MRLLLSILAVLLPVAAGPACRALADVGPDAASPTTVPSTQPATLFDPQRHMRVDEVRPGMTGYGLSVFAGTQIERFDVEVLSVLKNFNPRRDVILVRLSGLDLEHTGPVAGMSGSPIYLRDDQGRTRLAGAFAYGWTMSKDPVGGLQPIEYMLALRPPPAPTTQPAAGAAWRLDQAVAQALAVLQPHDAAAGEYASAQDRGPLGVRLEALDTPLMVSGMGGHLANQLAPLFAAQGMIPLRAGGAGGAGVEPATPIQPGSVLAVPLLTGDVDLTAIGTVTEVIDGQVFGFGHPFIGEGPVELPLGTGAVHGVIANLVASFKLGSLTQTSGTLYADQTVGVAGRLGQRAQMVPIDLQMRYADGSLERKYSFQSATHPRYTALISIAAVAMALSGEHELPQFHTLDYDLSIEFANGRKIRVANTVVNVTPADLLLAVGVPMMSAANNPFERVLATRVSGSITVTRQANEATIVSVTVPRLEYRPGQTLRAYVAYRPFRGEEQTLPVEFQIPADLPDGSYELSVSDYASHLADEEEIRPFRFSADSAPELFEVLEDLASLRHDALYVRLTRKADGVAVGRTAMPHLPGSRRQVMLESGRSDVTSFVSTMVQTIPTQHVISGAAQFKIKVDRQARVETAKPQPPAAEPAEPAAPRSETPPLTNEETPAP